MDKLFKTLMNISSTSLLLSIYFIKSQYYILDLTWLYRVIPNHWIEPISRLSLLFYFLIPFVATATVLWLSKYLGKDEFKQGEVKELEYVNDNFLPSYLGYFFVALSIPDNNLFLLFVMYGIIFLLVSCSKSFYFNPVFFLFGYRFYQVKTKSGLLLVLISKQEFRTPQSVSSITVYRINNFTFLEK
ncbi:hypothetical protein BBB48_08785 [Haemophilus parainfluenzae]|jgi:hypothetical protein|uniref:Uncharacterized protein n=1 Tax=Haemophilus parainfluenzae TaxID=729 RepID=A0AB36E6Y1_HAEPA|nr:hypothetical protein [Haemophilus parainfluenzae]OBY50292.1 hypothetical protein BBB48_08785 [Haemophilus parainfluenzae]